MKKRQISLRWKILIVLILVELLFVGVYQGYSVQMKNRIIGQLAREQRQSLSIFKTALADSFQKTDGLLYADAEDGLEYSQRLLGTNEHLTAAIQSRYGENEILFSENCPVNESYRRQVQNLLEDYINEENVDNGWTIVCQEESQHYYLMRRCVKADLKCAVLVDLQSLALSAQTRYLLMQPVVFVKNNEALTDVYWVRNYRQNGKVKKQTEDYLLLSSGGKNYLVVEDSLFAIKIMLAKLYTDNGKEIQYLGILAILFVIFSFFIIWNMFRKNVLAPLNTLLGVMEEVRNGTMTARVAVTRGMEFRKIDETFNEMLDQMVSLKLESYENELSANKARLDALRLQIRRHFFLNCLKSIYGMTFSGSLSDIRKMTLALSSYLRYTLNIDTDCVTLQEELQMCKNYIELQGIGQQSMPRLSVSVDMALLEFKIPPFSILTLLENCCKYGVRNDVSLEALIRIEEKQMDKQRMVMIWVQDNGPGFTEEMLKLLNEKLPDAAKDGHVGLTNVMERMNRLFGNGCSIWFGNQEGACVVITIQEG